MVACNWDYDGDTEVETDLGLKSLTSPKFDSKALNVFLPNTNLVQDGNDPIYCKNKDKDDFDRYWFKFFD